MACYSIYGLSLESDVQLHTVLEPSPNSPYLRFTCTTEDVVRDVDRILLYESPERGENGAAMFELYRVGEAFLISYPKSVDFYISTDTIRCHLHDPNLLWWVKILLLGPILSFWLELKGMLCLHASAIVTEQGAAGFLAFSKAGKTSIAASFVQSGAALLTDDILPVLVDEDGKVMARSGYPQMRMWPEQAEYFAGDANRFPRVHPHKSKVRVPVRELGTFHEQPAKLRALFLPQRQDPSIAGDITIDPMGTQDALMLLLSSSFPAPATRHVPEIQASRLEVASRIIEEVDLYRLNYPEGYDRLSDVRIAI